MIHRWSLKQLSSTDTFYIKVIGTLICNVSLESPSEPTTEIASHQYLRKSLGLEEYWVISLAEMITSCSSSVLMQG